MSAAGQVSDQWAVLLADRIPAPRDSAQIAEAVYAIWQDIETALHPIIGHGGVAALYSRSLSKVALVYPWLDQARLGQHGQGQHGQQDQHEKKSLLSATDPLDLKAVLAKQDAQQAAAAGAELFRTFRELLASLIGPSLTDRLLHSVWSKTAGPSSAQETP